MSFKKNDMMKAFNQQLYTDKKEVLLEMLRELAPTGNKDILEFWELVYALPEENENWLYTDVYEILIDSILSVEKDNEQHAIDKLQEVHSSLVQKKKEEQEERENDNLWDLLHNLD